MKIHRTFIPGSKWVYIKLYTGAKTADKILIKDIAYIISKLRKKDIIQKWFFIRYSDPEFHLRIRFLVKDESFVGEVLFLCYKRLGIYVDNNLIWKIQVDTYNREIERYSYILIEDSESVFQIDSDCILSMLKRMKNENYRWMIGLKLIDSFLNDFALNIDEKQILMQELMTGFRNEFGFTPYNSKQLNTKYRENKKTIESVLDNKIEDKAFINLYSNVRKRSKELISVVYNIKQKFDNNIKIESINPLLGSYIHMTLNRLFRSKNRQHELLLYDFMFRFYMSKIAQNKNTLIDHRE